MQAHDNYDEYFLDYLMRLFDKMGIEAKIIEKPDRKPPKPSGTRKIK